jgi:hypothetical protein
MTPARPRRPRAAYPHAGRARARHASRVRVVSSSHSRRIVERRASRRRAGERSAPARRDRSSKRSDRAWPADKRVQANQRTGVGGASHRERGARGVHARARNRGRDGGERRRGGGGRVHAVDRRFGASRDARTRRPRGRGEIFFLPFARGAKASTTTTTIDRSISRRMDGFASRRRRATPPVARVAARERPTSSPSRERRR